MSQMEYFEPHLLDGEHDRPDIGIELEKIYGLLLRADSYMSKTHRIRYNDRAIQYVEDIIEAFVLAYDIPDERLHYLKIMWGKIAVFIRLIRCMGEANAICVKPKYETMSANELKLHLLEHIGRLDEGATRWRNSVLKKRARPRSAAKADTGSSQENKGNPTQLRS